MMISKESELLLTGLPIGVAMGLATRFLMYRFRFRHVRDSNAKSAALHSWSFLYIGNTLIAIASQALGWTIRALALAVGIKMSGDYTSIGGIILLMWSSVFIATWAKLRVVADKEIPHIGVSDQKCADSEASSR